MRTSILPLLLTTFLLAPAALAQTAINETRPLDARGRVDISNIMGVMAVGSIVRFEDTRPAKEGYRLFRIRTVTGSNDFAMMHEVLSRRFSRS